MHRVWFSRILTGIRMFMGILSLHGLHLQYTKQNRVSGTSLPLREMRSIRVRLSPHRGNLGKWLLLSQPQFPLL